MRVGLWVFRNQVTQTVRTTLEKTNASVSVKVKKEPGPL